MTAHLDVVVQHLRRFDGLHRLVVRVEKGAVRDRLEPLPRNAETEEVHAAWERLCAVREIRPEVVRDVETVLAHTFSDPMGDRPALPSLTIEPPPAPHVPTQANPRAYKGTKDRPPKPRRPEPMDLRPFLCEPSGQDRLLERLRARGGVSVEEAPEFRGAPAGFARTFGRALRLQGDADGVRLQAVWHQLDLGRDAAARNALAAHAARVSTARALSLGQALVGVSPDLRGPVVLEFATLVGLEELELSHAERLADLLRDRHDEKAFVADVQYVVSELLIHRVDSDRLDAALRLRGEFAPNYEFEVRGLDRPASVEDVQRVRAFIDYLDHALAESASFDRSLAMGLWEACTWHEDEFGALLELDGWREIDPVFAYRLATHLKIFLSTLVHDIERSVYVFEEWPTILAAFRDADEPRRELALKLFEEVLHHETEDVGLARFTDWIRAAQSVGLPPSGFVQYVLERFMSMEAEEQDRILALPQASWDEIAAATRRKNDAWLISCGINALSHCSADFMLRSLVTAPRSLLRAAKILGAAAWPVRKGVVRAMTETPFWIDAATADLSTLVGLIRRREAVDGVQPMSKKLRQHFDGVLELSDAQLERHGSRVREAWDAVVCDELRAASLIALGQSRDAMASEPSEQIRHAWMMHARIDENRRGLRKMIRAVLEGDADYAAAHPTNQQWLRDHAEIDADVWLHGIELEREVPGHGNLRLAFELNPLEALRLGTHVGSCLGVGGSFAYSAAAIVLDVNKQVIFARDANGRFVARQIVALTESQKLAFYNVYPDSSAELQRAFVDFDRALAEAMGVEILLKETGDDDDLEYVDTIIASDWWDDSLWNLEVDEGE